MARVCEEWYPKGSYPYQKGDGFYMDNYLKEQLDVLLKNIVNDWDFTIIICGKGDVRVGKSVLAMQIAAYWSYMIEKLYGIKISFNLKDNFAFKGEELISKGNNLGLKSKYSPLIFDEAGSELEGRKTMRRTTQNVLDYFRECGQYNLLNILVLPEFFDLPRAIAITRSILLLNVTFYPDEEGIFERGFFDFLNRKSKKKLYQKGKKEYDYGVTEPDFNGRFVNFHPLDQEEYRKLKREALRSREQQDNKLHKKELQRNAAWYLLNHDLGLTHEEIGRKTEQLIGIETARTTITEAINRISLGK